MQSSLGWFRVAGWQKKLASATTIFALVVLSAGPLAVLSIPNNAEASTSIFTESFGTGDTSNDVPGWKESEHPNDNDDDVVAKQSSNTSSNADYKSPNDGRFLKIKGDDDEWACKQINAAGYTSLVLKYYWRGEASAEADDYGKVEFRANGVSESSCNSNENGAWTSLAQHSLDNQSGDHNQTQEAWALNTVNLPADSDGLFLIRYRNDSSSDGEYFRVDGISIEGEQMKGGLIVKKVVTNDNGGLLQPSAFSFSINNATPVSFEADGQNDFSVLPGTYSVVESASAGYATTYSGCSNVTVTAGATTTCTITNNDKPATLTVKKVVVGGTKTASDFAFSINNTTPIQFEEDGQNDVTVNAGTYSVSELSTPENYAASYDGCTDITLGLDGAATCTITNTYVPPAPSCNENASHSFVSDTTTLHGANPTVLVDIDLGTEGNQIHTAWTANIPGATWIWGENPVNTPSVEISETFTKTFTVAGTPNANASLMIAADNSYSVDVNGNIGVCVDTTEDNYSAAGQDTCAIPVGMLNSGLNTITFHVKNHAQEGGTPQSNPAGLLYKLTYTANECQNPEPVCDAEVNLLKNPSFEATPVSAGSWNIFASGAPSLDWAVSWLGSVVPFNDVNPPEVANAEIQNNGLLSVTASAGSQWTELDSDWDGPSGSLSGEPAQVSLSQDIPTIPGKMYKVSYDFQARPDTAASESKIEALKNGVVMDTADGTLLPSGWNTRTYTFTATGVTTNIEFRDAGSPSNSLGALLDNTKVMCQPEPPKGSVTICKYNTQEQSLSGWTMMLKGDKVEDLVVPTGTSAGINTVASLNAGQSYFAVAKGTWNNQGGANPVDPEYSTTDGWLSQMDGYTGYGAGILELEINQTDGAWGPYSATHEYAQAFVPGVNGSANFRIFDGDTGTHTQNEEWFPDNSGTLDVSVYKGYAGVTGENGCVTFTDVPYGTYSVDELLKQNWSNQSGLGTVTVDSPTETFNVVNKDNSQPTTATIVANKIVCDSETDLPNWGAGGADITSTTAADFLESHPNCHLAEWTFEWAPSVATNPGDNVLGAVGGAWTAFTGSATVPAGALVWVREQMQSGYVPFTGANTNQNVSAELYCNTDVLNYDNFDWIDPVEAGKTYYCVAFNAVQHVVDEDDGGTLTIIKNTVGGNGTFTFSLTNGEDVVEQPQVTTEEGSGSTLVTDLDGTYDLTELVPSGWTLSSVECVYDNESAGTQIENGKTISLDSGDHVICTFTNTKNQSTDGGGGGETPTPPTPPGGNPSFATFGGGGVGGGVLGASTSQILGASCNIKYLEKHLRMGKKNDPEQVKKLQIFLNKWENAGLPVTGFFGPLTYAAVTKFQEHYLEQVLKPWGLQAPTGIVYHTTQRWINLLECPDLQLELPPLTPWQDQ